VRGGLVELARHPTERSLEDPLGKGRKDPWGPAAPWLHPPGNQITQKINPCPEDRSHLGAILLVLAESSRTSLKLGITTDGEEAFAAAIALVKASAEASAPVVELSARINGTMAFNFCSKSSLSPAGVLRVIELWL
jgi:hypothetical protein